MTEPTDRDLLQQILQHQAKQTNYLRNINQAVIMAGLLVLLVIAAGICSALGLIDVLF